MLEIYDYDIDITCNHSMCLRRLQVPEEMAGGWLVQGRNVTDVFVTHQGTWLSLSSATPVAGADDAQNGATAASVEDLEAGHTAGGGKTRNPLQLGDDTLGILRKAETSKI